MIVCGRINVVPAIDTGFRVAALAQPDRFALSVQLARVLASLPEELVIGQRVQVGERVTLKGVNKGVSYPNLYLNTWEHLPLHNVLRSERKLIGAKDPDAEEVEAYLQRYCEAVSTDEIALPMRSADTPPEPPTRYSQAIKKLQEHLNQERLRSGEVQDADTDEGSDGDTPVEGGNLAPLDRES